LFSKSTGVASVVFILAANVSAVYNYVRSQTEAPKWSVIILIYVVAILMSAGQVMV